MGIISNLARHIPILIHDPSGFAFVSRVRPSHGRRKTWFGPGTIWCISAWFLWSHLMTCPLVIQRRFKKQLQAGQHTSWHLITFLTACWILRCCWCCSSKKEQPNYTNENLTSFRLRNPQPSRFSAASQWLAVCTKGPLAYQPPGHVVEQHWGMAVLQAIERMAPRLDDPLSHFESCFGGFVPISLNRRPCWWLLSPIITTYIYNYIYTWYMWYKARVPKPCIGAFQNCMLHLSPLA